MSVLSTHRLSSVAFLFASLLVLVTIRSLITGTSRLEANLTGLSNIGVSVPDHPALRLTRKSSSTMGPSIVTINGRQLMVGKRNADGTLAPTTPYIIHGVAWSPASETTNNSLAARRGEFVAHAQTDAPLIAAMNANTVRTYLEPPLDSTGLAVLDHLYSQGIMVILTVDEGTNNLSSIQQTVSFYKDHPAILMWLLGNEWNINLYYGHASSVSDAAQRTQTAANLIKTIDGNHPVAASLGDIDINESGKRLSDIQLYVNNICTSVDVWGINVYRGSNFGMTFGQWQSISSKPMFIGEFGTDAYHTTNYPPLTCPVTGFLDEAAQAEWDLRLWNDLAWNLSALYPNKVALGGTLFEWNDEWWKVAPGGSQQNCGHDQTPGGHPDIVSNEEYYGVVNINRQPRQVYQALRAAFAADYQPPSSPITLKADSAGGLFGNFAQFFKDGVSFYRKSGGAGGGRGFNIAVIDPCTGELIFPVKNFDTWGTRDSGSDRQAMIDFLRGLPNGVMILIAVGDEAGLTNFPQQDGCSQLQRPFVIECIEELERLGSTRIRNYCYHGSWAMISIKGLTPALVEQLSNNGPVTIQSGLGAPATISPVTKGFSHLGGTTNVSITSASSCGWATTNTVSWITVNSPSQGVGSGAISINVASNPGPASRAASLVIAGRTFNVTQTAAPPPPELLLDVTSGRGAALDSVLFTRDPIPIFNQHNFSIDRRTRVTLFAINAALQPGEDLSLVTAAAEDSQHLIHPLAVEFVGNTTTFNWLTQITVRLPIDLENAGDIWLSVTVRGVPSNKVLLKVRPPTP